MRKRKLGLKRCVYTLSAPNGKSSSRCATASSFTLPSNSNVSPNFLIRLLNGKHLLSQWVSCFFSPSHFEASQSYYLCPSVESLLFFLREFLIQDSCCILYFRGTLGTPGSPRAPLGSPWGSWSACFTNENSKAQNNQRLIQKWSRPDGNPIVGVCVRYWLF